jgi:retinol-binding protein 3
VNIVRRLSVLVAVLLLWPALSACADAARDAPRHAAAVMRIAELVRAEYVFPDTGAQVAAALEAKLAAGGYEKLRDAEALAHGLTEDMGRIAQDRHLWVMASPAPPPGAQPPQGPQASVVREVRMLAGHVGYLSVGMFTTREAGAAELASAMAAVATAKSLIVDLRESTGGHPEMVELLASYLTGPEPVHLFDVYRRIGDKTDAYWSDPQVGRPRFDTRPLCVLTAGSTFSAGEGLAYTLKHLGRATLVGETTGGGAHPGWPRRIDDELVLFVAHSRVISPVTGKNWEGVGVRPHVEVDAGAALETALGLPACAML